MAYRFKLNEPLTRGVRRIALAQLDLAESRLKSGSDRATAVHEVRKCLKRTRALVRLVRPAIGDSVYRRENGQLRDAGRLLSPVRDRDVMSETLQKLEARLSGNCMAVAQRLRERLQAEHGAGPLSAADLRKAKATLAQARKRFARIEANGNGFDPLEAGLEAAYRKGRRALARVVSDPDDELFHDLRKAVQQHWRQMLLLSRAWPEVCRARASAAREIAQLLGEEHDHAVLTAYAVARRGDALPEEDVGIIEQACRQRQAELRALAIPKAKRLFAQRAGSFAQQMATHWAAARELAKLERAAMDPDKKPRSAQTKQDGAGKLPRHQD